MGIQIIEHIDDSPQVVIKCRKIDEEVIRLKKHIELFDKTLQAKKENELFFVHLSDVLYFESVDNRTYLYTEDSVLEVKQEENMQKRKKDMVQLFFWHSGHFGEQLS